MRLADKTQGRWDSILISFGIEKKILNRINQPCPFCGGKDRFRYVNKTGNGFWICNQCAPEGADGFEFLIRMYESDFKSIAKMVEDRLGMTTEVLVEDKTEENAKRIRGIWGKSIEVTKDTATWKYLEGRGLNPSVLDPVNVREAVVPYYDIVDEKPVLKGKFPSMVCKILTKEGKGASLHITYLTEDGEKADVEVGKKILPKAADYNGGMIKLTRGDFKRVSVGEGVETSLKFCQKEGFDCCAAISESGLRAWIPPKEVEFVTILGDNDLNYIGQKAAYTLANNLSRLRPEIIISGVEIPSAPGTDWGDL